MIDEGLKIFEVNLAVSNICNANCLYCPRSFRKDSNPFMSVETVETIMDEVSTPEFKAEHPVVHSVVSENGEPFLNQNILDILRTVRKAGLYISMFSNCSLLTYEIGRVILCEHLIDNLHVNIDGASDKTYKAVKGLDLSTVEENLKKFIALRNAIGSPVRVLVHVISHYTYTQAVKSVFGVGPVKGDGYFFYQDGPLVVEKWKKNINPQLDAVGEDSVMFWAERYNKHPISINGARCPNLDRIRHVAYINPSGKWYACCFDTGNDLFVGNVLKDSILKVSQSPDRKELIAKLELGLFEEIGFPCSRVDACGGKERSTIV